jgi:hypothetical protein
LRGSTANSSTASEAEKAMSTPENLGLIYGLTQGISEIEQAERMCDYAAVRAVEIRALLQEALNDLRPALAELERREKAEQQDEPPMEWHSPTNETAASMRTLGPLIRRLR